MVEKVNINDIQVGRRARKDFGDIEELAESIKKNGLINPITVTPNKVLLAGERRLKACKLLGLDEVKVHVMDVDDYAKQLEIERDENDKRKPLTASEMVAIGEELENVERVKAEERMLAGKKPDPMISRSQGSVRKIVAKKLGTSEGNYARAKRVVNSGNKDLIEKVDKGEINLSLANDVVAGRKTLDGKKVEKPKEEAENKVQRGDPKNKPKPKPKQFNQQPPELPPEEIKKQMFDANVETFFRHLNELAGFIERTEDFNEVVEEAFERDRTSMIGYAKVLEKTLTLLKLEVL